MENQSLALQHGSLQETMPGEPPGHLSVHDVRECRDSRPLRCHREVYRGNETAQGEGSAGERWNVPCGGSRKGEAEVLRQCKSYRGGDSKDSVNNYRGSQ